MSFGLPDEFIEKITSILHAYPEVEKVIIYGSRAKGNFREGSDIDMVLQGEKLTNEVRNQIFWEIDELNSPYSLDLTLYHQIKSLELIQHIDRVGKLLYHNKNQTLNNE